MKSLKGLEPEAKTSKERKKMEKWIESKRRHLKVLIRYLDKDYSHVKKRLPPSPPPPPPPPPRGGGGAAATDYTALSLTSK